MLALFGLITIILLLVLIMGRVLSPIVALVIVPLATALMAGFTFEIIDFVTSGILSIATTAVMFVFAILFFGILTDAGTFRPIIAWLLKQAGNDPVRITVVTAILAMLVHLDGSGAVTFLVTIPALLPLYDALNMRRTTLAAVVALAAGTMNILPWGGPTIRAASALDVEVTQLFNPILFPVIIGLLTVLLIAIVLGRREKKRMADLPFNPIPTFSHSDDSGGSPHPVIFAINIILIITSITALIGGWAPPYLIFMIAFALAVSINYPRQAVQRERIDAHAKEALLMAGILFAAGCFTGILKESGMIDAMATYAVSHVPEYIGSNLAVVTGALSMPASLLFDPDSFYFGILPLLGSTAEHFGADPLDVGRAAIMGQMTTGFPVSPLTGSTYLLIGLTGVELAEHQKKTIPLAFLVTLVILLVSIITGSIAL